MGMSARTFMGLVERTTRLRTARLLVWVGLLLLLNACSSLRKTPQATKPRKPFPEKIDPRSAPDTVARIPGKMDTIQWTITEEVMPDLPAADMDHRIAALPTLFADKQHYYKDAYKIVVILPFMADTEGVHTANRVAQWANDFYLGLKLALQTYSPRDLRLDVEVLDSRGSEERLKQLINQGKFDDADVVIGPYRSNVAQVLTAHLKDRPTVLLSPYSAQTTLGAGIPQYLQGNPSLERHLEIIFRHVRLYASEDRPVVFVNTLTAGESARPGMWNRLCERLTARERSNFYFHTIDASDLSLSNVSIDSLLPGRRGAHIVFPAWEERAVVALMRKLVAEKLDKEVTLYGLQQWRGYEGIHSAQLQALNVMLSSSDYFELTSTEMRELNRRFMETYKQPMAAESVWGYRMGRFVVDRLKEDGALFQRFLPLAEDINRPVSAGVKDFQIVTAEDGRFLRIENRKVILLQYQDGTFVPVK